MKEISPYSINAEAIIIPEVVENDKSPSMNGMGYIFFSISPIGEAFLQNEAKANKVVLEIGAGFSDLSVEALNKDIRSYTANDLSQAHLEILVARIHRRFGNSSSDKLKKLKLWHGKAPRDLPNVEDCYDAIIIDKVLHFMNPQEILQFIQWTKRALHSEGKLYVTTVSPFSSSYEALRPMYLEKCIQGSLFPGHFQNAMRYINSEVIKKYPDFRIPDEIVLFARRDLINLFEREEMEIVQTYSLDIPNEERATWCVVDDEKSNVAGVIVKNARKR